MQCLQLLYRQQYIYLSIPTVVNLLLLVIFAVPYYLICTENAGDDLEVQSNDEGDWELRVVAYKDAWNKCLSRMQVRLADPSLIYSYLLVSDSLL
jgi:hypothetical protein